MFYTYAHFKPDNSVFYIGKGHGRRAWSTKGRNIHWRRIVAKYGDHRVQILAQWKTEQEAFEHEKFLIACFRDMGFVLANITLGGEGATGLVHTEEVKRKISLINKGRKPTPEQVEKIRLKSLNRKHSEQTKQYLSKINKERVLTADQKQRIRNAHLGKSLSEETKRKISLAHLGKTMSDEHRAIISATHKGKKQSSEQVKKRIAARLATLAARKSERN
jgi:hypothetical protein